MNDRERLDDLVSIMLPWSYDGHDLPGADRVDLAVRATIQPPVQRLTIRARADSELFDFIHAADVRAGAEISVEFDDDLVVAGRVVDRSDILDCGVQWVAIVVDVPIADIDREDDHQ